MKFTAFERKLQGTGASRRLRVAGKVPGIVYGAGEPTNIELDHNALFHALKKEAFHSSILDMELAGATTQVLLRDFQMHPYKPQVQHIDFQRVDATTKITKKVPLHFIGEAESVAVKTDKCTVNHIITELRITCLAQQLPEFIEVDLSGLTLGHSLHINDLKLPAGVKAIVHGKPNPAVATAVPPVAEEIVVAAAPVEDAKGKKKKK
ncbi:50S ribosomal protein L25/general stress protein Ctc [Pelomonas sp. KK5]|uniref:50S ribosomal protein L25/general stress protein Ctc n=1 Tax=Pelomonas sp. KK5 TaxID=1855730 RepID=UPI00097BE52E|nr:50S ribosomal protein L25/general stress protein Ctc [Pelomonas sp. KK5]